MHTPQTMRARWVLPISAPPIQDGEIVVDGDTIVAVRAASGPAKGGVRDFGDAILMPGLVNVHTHLEYTVMRGLLEDIAFFPWIRELTRRKSALDLEDWQASATWGAAEAVAGGVTTIGDCTDSGAAMFGAARLGMRGTIYQEVFGIDERQSVDEILRELRQKLAAHRASASGTLLRTGISPHAPYTVRPALMRALGTASREDEAPLCIHAAESTAEAMLFRSSDGPIGDMFRRREIVWTPPHCTAVAYLAEAGVLGPRTLLVHGTQISASDRPIMRASGAAWAHCPKSNAKLGNGIAALAILADEPSEGTGQPGRHGVRVGLGTDSVASNNTMDMFEEMRFAVLMQRGAGRSIEALSARQAVYMATLGGAAALGLDSAVGSLEPGKSADICVVSLDALSAVPAYDPYSALVYAAGARDVIFTQIGGIVQYSALSGAAQLPGFPNIDLAPTRHALLGAADKMRLWRPEQT